MSTFHSAGNGVFSFCENTDNQHCYDCANSTAFTGKERDGETGYSYFGARYYDSDLSGLFLSVDPMSDKYPNITPYAYCAWNPVKLVDPDGNIPILPIIAAFYYGTAHAMEYAGDNRYVKEIGFALKRPIIAASIGTMKSISVNMTRTASNFEKNIAHASRLSTGNPGDYGNAFRHTFWQALIAKRYGKEIAERIGNAHEDNITEIKPYQRIFNSLDEADRVADFLNNQIGRRLGDNQNVSNTEMAVMVISEFYKNGLWVTEKRLDGKISLVKRTISFDQYINAKLEIYRLKENGYEN